MVILQMDVLHEYVGKSLVLDSDRTNSIPNVAPMEIYLTQVSQFSRLRRDHAVSYGIPLHNNRTL
mgnify:CR=1 FL=1|jgi:hypothetical protein